jgi:hypothetical protein
MDGDRVFDLSGGLLSVEPRPACPAMVAWADPRFCWQATAALDTTKTICMAVAKRKAPPPDSVRWAVI